MDLEMNRALYEGKDPEELHQKSHIRKNLWEWLRLGGGDYFWAVPKQAGWNEFLEMLHRIKGSRGSQPRRIILALSNPFGVAVWNRGRQPAQLDIGSVKRELAQMGYTSQRQYYPYPDADFPMRIYSPDRLPAVGELGTERMRNFGPEELIFQEEGALYDRMIEMGRWEDYANAIILSAEKRGASQATGEGLAQLPIYVQYANDRAPGFQMKTEIWQKGDARRVVKRPMDEAASAHCAHILESYGKLQALTEGTPLVMNHCRQVQDGLELEYLEGNSLAKELQTCFNQGKDDAARELVLAYTGTLRQLASRPFEATQEFEAVFGAGREFSCQASMPVTDIDLIFQNIICGKSWNVIDYEWTFDFPIPVDYVVYRAFSTFLQGNEAHSEELYGAYPIPEADRQTYAAMEESFQQYVSQGYHTLNEMYLSFGRKCRPVAEELWEKEQEANALREKIWQMEHTKVWKCYQKYKEIFGKK